MATINVHAGHNKIVPGAGKYLNEVTEDRKVKNKVIILLKAAGHTVYDCTDDSGTTQSKNLSNIVAKCNAHNVDLDISIHLNAGGGTGTEILYTSAKGKTYAAKVSAAVAEALGIKNRGAKKRDDLYVLNHTKAPAILVECCFVDSKTDTGKWNVDKCAAAIVKGVTGKTNSAGSAAGKSEKPKVESTGKPEAAKSYAKSYKRKYTTTANLNLRMGAGENKNIILTIPKGKVVTCYGYYTKNGSTTWLYVQYGDKTGYCSKAYLK